MACKGRWEGREGRRRNIKHLSASFYFICAKVATGRHPGNRAAKAASHASLAAEFTAEIHSIPHSNSPLITDENMFYGVC